MSLPYKCQAHGLPVAYVWDKINSVNKEFGCRLCSLEKEKAIKKSQKKRLAPKKMKAYKIVEQYKCSQLSGCIPCEKYHHSICETCSGKWEKMQNHYISAFKPQAVEWRWNQI